MVPPLPHELGQIGGDWMRTAVYPSMVWNSTSDESPTSTVPLIGSTHAKLSGLPEYVIWSQRVVESIDEETIIRCPETWVFSVWPTKHPPHADAVRGTKREAADASD